MKSESVIKMSTIDDKASPAMSIHSFGNLFWTWTRIQLAGTTSWTNPKICETERKWAITWRVDSAAKILPVD